MSPKTKETKPKKTKIKTESAVRESIEETVATKVPTESASKAFSAGDEDERELDKIIAAADQAASEAGIKEKFYEAVGRRKETTARVRLFTKKSSDNTAEDKGLITVNNKPYDAYFTDKNLQIRIEAPLRKLKSLHRFKATVLVSGGGLSGQADAIRHGISRALEKFDINFRKKLKKAGYLTRDPREKERRKFGHKGKARKSGRWSKR